MKIIAKGKTWSEIYTCPDCKVQLEVDDNDVRVGKELHKSIWDNDWYTDYFYVDCPQCRIRLIVDPPDWVENKAKAR